MLLKCQRVTESLESRKPVVEKQNIQIYLETYDTKYLLSGFPMITIMAYRNKNPIWDKQKNINRKCKSNGSNIYTNN